MKSALKNFSIVIFIVFISLFTAWLYLHNKGLQRITTSFQAGFFTEAELKNTRLLIALRGESLDFPENTLPAFEAAAKINPDIVLWADVSLSKDGVPVVTRHQDLSPYGGIDAFVPLLSFEEIEKIDAGYNYQKANLDFSFRGKGLKILSVKKLVESFPNHRFVINLIDDSVGLEQQLIKAIDYSDKTHRFIITSERDKIIKQTRKIAPMLLYGASTPQLTQLMILANLFLQNLAPLDADVLVIEKTVEKIRTSRRVHLNDKMIQEAHRRSLKVFAGNAQNSQEASALVHFGVDGVISSHPNLFINFYKKHDFSR